MNDVMKGAKTCGYSSRSPEITQLCGPHRVIISKASSYDCLEAYIFFTNNFDLYKVLYTFACLTSCS
jgi:hypothetical protein